MMGAVMEDSDAVSKGTQPGAGVPYLTKLPPSFLGLGKNFHP
jgi:hypothetical protein